MLDKYFFVSLNFAVSTLVSVVFFFNFFQRGFSEENIFTGSRSHNLCPYVITVWLLRKTEFWSVKNIFFSRKHDSRLFVWLFFARLSLFWFFFLSFASHSSSIYRVITFLIGYFRLQCVERRSIFISTVANTSKQHIFKRNDGNSNNNNKKKKTIWILMIIYDRK